MVNVGKYSIDWVSGIVICLNHCQVASRKILSFDIPPWSQTATVCTIRGALFMQRRAHQSLLANGPISGHPFCCWNVSQGQVQKSGNLERNRNRSENDFCDFGEWARCLSDWNWNLWHVFADMLMYCVYCIQMNCASVFHRTCSWFDMTWYGGFEQLNYNWIKNLHDSFVFGRIGFCAWTLQMCLDLADDVKKINPTG